MTSSVTPSRQDIVAALEAAIAFLTNADGAGFGTTRMDGYQFHQAAHDLCKRLRAALASEPEPQPGAGWQDISTAPKDGTAIVLFFPTYRENKVGTYRFDCNGPDGWESLTGWGDVDGEDAPTHWRPLPAAPRPAEEPSNG